MKPTPLSLAAIAAVLVTFVRAIFFTPLEATQGPAQKILYVHAPAAWVAFMAFGLVGLKERALLLDGSVEIDSAPGRGTRVELRIPVASGERP